MAPYEMLLRNGYRAVMETSGKETLLRIFNNEGNLVKTRIRSVAKQSVQPKQASACIGFVRQNAVETNDKTKDIFTITKNTFDHVKEKSEASILDRVYLNSERVGERVRKASGDKPMEAMDKLKGKNYCDADVTKILRSYKGGVVSKENSYEFINGIRRSRTNNPYATHESINNKRWCLEHEAGLGELSELALDKDLKYMQYSRVEVGVPVLYGHCHTDSTLLAEQKRFKKEREKLIRTFAKERDEAWNAYLAIKKKVDNGISKLLSRAELSSVHPNNAFTNIKMLSNGIEIRDNRCTTLFNGAKIRSDIEGVDFTL